MESDINLFSTFYPHVYYPLQWSQPSESVIPKVTFPEPYLQFLSMIKTIFSLRSSPVVNQSKVMESSRRKHDRKKKVFF